MCHNWVVGLFTRSVREFCCPVCSVSTSDARALLKHVSSNYVVGLEQEVLSRHAMFSDRGFYFCLSSAALNRLPVHTSVQQYIESHFPRLRTVVGLGHDAVVNPSPRCIVCAKEKRDAIFLEFKSIRESGGSHMVGDPSIHCTMKDIRWIRDFDTFNVLTLGPVHKNCSPGHDVLPYHMGNRV